MDHLRFEKIAAHRNNIRRYRRLLRTHLTDLERQFIERRLEEERQALRKLVVSPPYPAIPPEVAAKAMRRDKPSGSHFD
jgi:hypothetical protein